MALKNRITKTAYDKLSDDLKEHYEADGDKHFKLEVEGLEDTGALTRALDRAKETATEQADEIKTLKKDNKALTDAAGDGGAADVQRLTRQHERKVASLTEEHTTTLKGRDAFISKTLIDSQATALATAISTVPSLMADHVKKRLSVDFTGAEPKLVILDKDGKPAPALTIDTLKAELLTVAELKPILRGSQATGSTATTQARQAGNANGAPQVVEGEANKSVDVNALSNDAFVERVKAKHQAANEGKSQAA